MPDVKQYALSAISLSINGILIEGGGGEGGFFQINLPQGFDTQQGVHGDVVSFPIGAGFAEATLTLLDPSEVNQDLFSLFDEDKLSETGSGIGDFLLEDLNSTMEIAGQVRLTKPPDIQKTAVAQDFEWQMHVFQPRVRFVERAVVV